MRKLLASLVVVACIATVVPLLAQGRGGAGGQGGQGGETGRGVLGPVGALGQEVVRRAPGSTEPAPRLPDGTIDLNGLWVGGGPVNSIAQGLKKGETLPLLPAAKALMDQRLVVGVGNIYANEALFAAGIDPSRAANTLSLDDITRLHREVQRILEAAIASNGTTFRDYRTGTGESGNFQLELMVYEREGEPCRVCGTTLAGTHSIDARITVFCWRCQRRKDGTTE